MLKKISGLCLTLSALALAGCGDKTEDMSCPANGETFFRSSIDSYYGKHDQAMVGKYALTEGERYDATNNWWVVPFNLEDKQYLAMISCDGRLELSLGTP